MGLATNIFNLCLTFENNCRTNDEKLAKQLFSAKFKILFTIFERKMISQKVLCETICMAKPNVAMFCKELKTSKLIKTQIDEYDKRIIYYSLTNSGKKHVEKLTKQLGLCFEKGTFDETTQKLENVIKESKNA